LKKPKEFINALFDMSILMIGLFGLAVGLIISFADGNFFPQEKISATILIMLGVLVFQTSRFIESSGNKTNDAEKQTLDSRLHELINSLAKAGNAITAIEREIDSRQELVGKL